MRLVLSTGFEDFRFRCHSAELSCVSLHQLLFRAKTFSSQSFIIWDRWLVALIITCYQIQSELQRLQLTGHVKARREGKDRPSVLFSQSSHRLQMIINLLVLFHNWFISRSRSLRSHTHGPEQKAQQRGLFFHFVRCCQIFRKEKCFRL